MDVQKTVLLEETIRADHKSILIASLSVILVCSFTIYLSIKKLCTLYKSVKNAINDGGIRRVLNGVSIVYLIHASRQRNRFRCLRSKLKSHDIYCSSLVFILILSWFIRRIRPKPLRVRPRWWHERRGFRLFVLRVWFVRFCSLFPTACVCCHGDKWSIVPQWVGRCPFHFIYTGRWALKPCCRADLPTTLTHNISWSTYILYICFTRKVTSKLLESKLARKWEGQHLEWYPSQ